VIVLYVKRFVHLIFRVHEVFSSKGGEYTAIFFKLFEVIHLFVNSTCIKFGIFKSLKLTLF
jgi:hypothetical protein